MHFDKYSTIDIFVVKKSLIDITCISAFIMYSNMKSVGDSGLSLVPDAPTPTSGTTRFLKLYRDACRFFVGQDSTKYGAYGELGFSYPSHLVRETEYRTAGFLFL